jgi:uncharacterized protein
VRLDPFNGKVVSHVVEGSHPKARCAFALKEFAVAASGRIYPCDRMVKRDDEAAQATCIGHLDTGLDEAKRARLLAARDHVQPECEACGLQRRCQHHCGCANQESTGDPGRVSPVLSWFERRVIAETDRVANALYEERSPAFLRRFYG